MSKEKPPPIDIRPDHWAIVRDILRRHVPDCAVWAFGSRARWTAKPYSDLDLAVSCAAPLTLEKLGALRDAFSESDLPWKVDVVDLVTVDAAFRKIIEAGKVEVQGGERPSVKGWPKMTLREAGVVLIDCVHKTPAEVQIGYAYITIPQLKNGRIDFSTARRISEPDFRDWTKKVSPREHDIVLSRRTNPGVTATVFKDDEAFALGQNLVLLRSKDTYVKPEFVRWLTCSPEWWKQIHKYINVGAVFDSLKCRDVPDFTLTIPPIRDQRAIASILSALDDKIELNRRMNETLEQMAQAIFKDWFVDFGPVRRKQQGARDPIAIMGGLVQDAARVAELAELFPDAFGNDGLPKGWGSEPLLEHANLISGGTPKTGVQEYWNGDIKWASAKDISQCGEMFLIETERAITERGLNESSTRMIPAFSTVVVARGATTGRFCLFGQKMAMNQTCYALTSDLRPFWLNRAFANLVGALIHAAHGSVFDTITTKTIAQAYVINPGASLLDAFEGLAAALYGRVHSSTRESRLIAETRDYLLPKLISGDVCVRDAETNAEAAL